MSESEPKITLSVSEAIQCVDAVLDHILWQDVDKHLYYGSTLRALAEGIAEALSALPDEAMDRWDWSRANGSSLPDAWQHVVTQIESYLNALEQGGRQDGELLRQWWDAFAGGYAGIADYYSDAVRAKR